MKLYSRLVRYVREAMLTRDEWFKAICESYTKPPVIIQGQKLPSFPSDTVQTNTTGQAGIGTLKEAFFFYEDCIETFRKRGAPVQHHHTLLDFGVGWGRITRFFLREVPLENLYGIDVTEDFIQLCRSNFLSDNFHVVAPFPPTHFPENKFNFVIGYSVFSHLSEVACARWMEEFHRILAPGGMVALTTRGRAFFDFCESLRNQASVGYLAALSNMFDDFDRARAKYDRGEFVHSNRDGINGGGAMTAEFYGESFIPESYAKVAYNELFALTDFLFDPARHTQPIMFFRRR